VPLEASPSAVVMLGIDGVRVLGARDVDGEVELTIETIAERDWCRACGVRAHSKGRPDVVVRDVDAFGRRARLRWRKRRWRCPQPACPVGSWTQQHPAVGARMVLTERARAAACRRVGRDGHSVAAVARDLGVGWHTIMRAVVDHGQSLSTIRLAPTVCVPSGVDETSFLQAGPQRRTRFVTGLAELDRARLLDVVDGRAGAAVTGWLASRDQRWLSTVERVALDPYRGYYNALVGGLDAPEVVVDAFHIIKPATP
jgi:transposase